MDVVGCNTVDQKRLRCETELREVGVCAVDGGVVQCAEGRGVGWVGCGRMTG